METTARPPVSKRQNEKTKLREIKDKHFLINWLDEEDDKLYDVVPSKTVVPPDGVGILDVGVGAICRVAFGGQYYRAQVIRSGIAKDLRQAHKEIEKNEVEQLPAEDSSGVDQATPSIMNNSFQRSTLKNRCSNDNAKLEKAVSDVAIKDAPPVTSPNLDDSVKIKGKNKAGPSKEDLSASPLLQSTPKKSVRRRKAVNVSEELDDSSDDDQPKKTKLCHKIGYNYQVDLLSDSECSDTSEKIPVVVKKTKPLTQQKLLENAKREWQVNNIKPTTKRSRYIDENDLVQVSQKQFEKLKEKVYILQESVEKLNKKIRLQSQEIRYLKENSASSFLDSSRPASRADSPTLDIDSTSAIKAESTDSTTTLIAGVPIDNLKLQAAKLHQDTTKCALAMMGCLFTAEELTNGNPAGVSNSKDESRRKGIKQLDPKRIAYIQSHIESKWPGKYASVTRNMTQKCTDTYKNNKDLWHGY